MHSYDNGTAVRSKKDNWAQLVKIFRKLGLSDKLSEDEVGQVMRCEENAAVLFITKLYEILTQRKVVVNVKAPSIGRTAGYAKETGAWRVKEALRKSNVVETGDDVAIGRFTAEVVEMHERSLQDDKSLDPDRYSGVSRHAPRNSQALKNKSEPEETELPQVLVKEIQVKQLDRNVTHLRASKYMNSGTGSVSPSINSKSGYRGGTPGGARTHESQAASVLLPHIPAADGYGQNSHSNVRGAVMAENTSSLLNTCISRVINPDNVPRWHAGLEPVQNLVSMLDHLRMGGNTTDSFVSAAIREIQSSAHELAEACIVTPKQFWKVSDLFVNMLVLCPQNSKSYGTVVECFAHIGYTISQRDPRSSLALFCDFTLFKLIPTIQSHSRKRLGILQILLSFSPADSFSHVQCIKKLQDALSGSNGVTLSEAASQMLPIFISCLTILATLETCLDDVLLDLYLYYSTIALGMSSPRVRAGGIGVLATLYGRARDNVSQALPQLCSLAKTEKWWEVHVYLLSLCARILEGEIDAPGSTQPEVCSYALEIVEHLFSSSSSKNIKIWGVAVLAKGATYNEAVTTLYLSILTELDKSDRLYFLGINGNGSNGYGYRTLDLPSSSGMPFTLDTISKRWDHTAVVNSIVGIVKSSGLDRLSVQQFEVIYSCIITEVMMSKVVAGYENAEDVAPGNWLSDNWIELFETVKDHVFVGLCDPVCAEFASAIVSEFIKNSALGCGIIKEKRFTGIMRLIYPADKSSDEHCQTIFQSFLRNTFGIDDECAGVVLGVIENFANNYTISFEVSNLQSLLKEFSAQV